MSSNPQAVRLEYGRPPGDGLHPTPSAQVLAARASGPVGPEATGREVALSEVLEQLPEGRQVHHAGVVGVERLLLE